ncbi:cupin domain-containing protein [Vreelandella populi]|uniref:Cupin domain-containing protein n=1 Tax=Vreelandella populi TaxID=2498858 RepID=A0A433LAN0_9GAMM|nr:cupin domain-containing protein [Halomonas populi]RUR45130.1 cupin domain-containing protein [Halomonas populi]
MIKSNIVSKECADNKDDGITTEQLVQSPDAWNGTPYERYPAGRPQLTVMRMTIPAHTSLPLHTHPMPNAAYILSGQLTLEEYETGKTQIFKAGEAFNEAVGDIHRGYTTEDPVVVIVTYAGVKGMPLSETLSNGSLKD